MLPDLRLLLAAMAVTILLVMKLGSNIVATTPDPYIGLSDVAQVRRSVVPQALPDNPEQRQLQTLAVSRRIDELHRLLDLPGGTVTFTDKGDPNGAADLPVNPMVRPAQAPPAAALLPTRQDPDSVVLAPEQRGDGVVTSPPGTTAELARDETGSIAIQRDGAAPAAVVLAPESSEVAPDKQSPSAGVASAADTSNAAATQPTPPAQPALPLRRSRGRLAAKEAHPAVRKKLAARRPTPGTQAAKPNTDNPFSPMFGNNH